MQILIPNELIADLLRLRKALDETKSRHSERVAEARGTDDDSPEWGAVRAARDEHEEVQGFLLAKQRQLVNVVIGFAEALAAISKPTN
jgi:hypothetical protein